MEIKNYLEQLGVTGKKANVYLAALELGSATVIDIAKKAGVKRTTAYDVLLDLEQMNLVSQTAKGKKRLFVGEDPEKIKKDLERKQRIINEALPMLQSIYNVKGAKPKIQFYEGKAGLIEVYNDTLKYNQPIYAFTAEDNVRSLGKEWALEYIARRVKKNIFLRGIVPNSPYLYSDFLDKDQEQLRQSKLVDPKKYPFSIEINIYGFQKVALMSGKDEMAIIIEGAEIYRTMKSIFQLLWDNLPDGGRQLVNRQLDSKNQ